MLLAIFVGVGHIGNAAPGRTKAASAFIPVWLVLALVNVTIGVVYAGYTVLQEAPVFAVTFAVPAAAAWYVQRYG
jgi:hypothetical protein